MREILFRGKAGAKWVYGDLRHLNDGRVTIEKDGEIYPYEVIPETVGQYTGLTDKNDKRIFEGDVVKVKSWYVVVFEDGAFGLKAYNKTNPVPLMGHMNFEGVMKRIKVIGNIHDNPELLEAKS